MFTRDGPRFDGDDERSDGEERAEHTVPRLRDGQGRPKFNLKFYLLAKDGAFAGVSMWGPSKLAVTDARGSRLEECTSLYQGDPDKPAKK